MSAPLSLPMESAEGVVPPAAAVGESGRLSQIQLARLRVHCEYIDRLLGEIEEILSSAERETSFPRYIPDVLPAEARTIEAYVRQLRGRLLDVLNSVGVSPKAAAIPVSRSIKVHLTFVEIAIEELKPKYMRGSGAVGPSAQSSLNAIVEELNTVASRFHDYLDARDDLQLPVVADESHTHVRELGELVERYALVQHRPALVQLARSAERTDYEIAFFGRVSSGKSSLMNALLGANLLPVGVNPVTAVPTRIEYGSEASLTVKKAGGSFEETAVEKLPEFSTETGNPGNWKGVEELVLRVPLARLAGEVVFVDTPGIGSLAEQGARETMAYLPAADLAIVLLDAAGSLGRDDLGLIRLLDQSRIPVIGLLSKADLLEKDQIASVLAYMQNQLASQVSCAVPLRAISAVAAWEAERNLFFEQEIAPRVGCAHDLRSASHERKTRAFARTVLRTLEKHSDDQSSISTVGPSAQTKAATECAAVHVRSAAAVIANLRAGEAVHVFRVTGLLGNLAASLANEVAERGKVPQMELCQVLRDTVAGLMQGMLDEVLQELGTAESELKKGLSKMDRAEEGDPDLKHLLRRLPSYEPVCSGGLEVGAWHRLRGRSHLIAKIGSSIAEQRPEIRAGLETYRRAVMEWLGEIAKSSQEMLDLSAGSLLDWRVETTDASRMNREQWAADLEVLRRVADLREEAIL